MQKPAPAPAKNTAFGSGNAGGNLLLVFVNISVRCFLANDLCLYRYVVYSLGTVLAEITLYWLSCVDISNFVHSSNQVCSKANWNVYIIHELFLWEADIQNKSFSNSFFAQKLWSKLLALISWSLTKWTETQVISVRCQIGRASCRERVNWKRNVLLLEQCNR